MSSVSFPILSTFLLSLVLPMAVSAETKQTVSAEDWCAPLVKRLPTISQSTCERAGFKPSGRTSEQGFPLLVRDVTPSQKGKKKRERPLRVLLMGGIHGDELTSSAIVFRWLDGMQTPAAQRFVWRVMPVVNPDGLLAKRASRLNANGVDLNRNFPTPGWEREAPKYWARMRKDPRRFPGNTALSEAESRWVEEEMKSFMPDVIVSVHAPFGVLDFDGPTEPPDRFGRLRLNRVGIYPGSLGNYGGVHKNVPVITIELPNAQKMPNAVESRRIWQDMLRWMDDNVVRREADDGHRSAAAGGH